MGIATKNLLPVLCALVLGACASFSQDGGLGTVEKIAREQGKPLPIWVNSATQRQQIVNRVDTLLNHELSLDAAIEIALLNNPGLQASYWDLGISEAELVAAGTLPNPHFSMFRASKVHAGVREFKVEQALGFNLFALITKPRMLAIEKHRFEQTQYAVGMNMLQLAAQTQKAFYQAVATSQLVTYSKQVMDTAEASAELARRMAKAGNFNKLQQAREQNFYADAALGVARAKQQELIAREQLTRLLGLWDDKRHFVLPERLPDLPKAFVERPDIEKLAIAQRLDLQMTRLQTELLAKQLGFSKVTRFIDAFEFGPARVAEGNAPLEYKKGFELAFELPLFDWGGARVARAKAIYEKHLNEAGQTAIDARSEVRQAYQMAFSQWEIAKHQLTEIVPLRKKIADENLLRYNGMIIGVFELLADTRSQIQSVIQAIESQRDFWLAQADLDMALIGKPSFSAIKAVGTSTANDAGGH